jgi:hypothetical protein
MFVLVLPLLQQFWMTMSLIYCRICRQEIIIFLPSTSHTKLLPFQELPVMDDNYGLYLFSFSINASAFEESV